MFCSTTHHPFRLLLLACICVSLCVIGFGRRVDAAAVTPAIIELNVSPAEIAHGTITLKNDSEGPVVYYPTVQNFMAEGEDGQQSFFSESESSGLARWLVVPSSPITIAPGAERSIPWSVKIPSTAEAGGYDAVVFFSTAPPKSGNVFVGMRIGVLFLVDVKGDVAHAASIESFRTSSETQIGSLFGIPIFDRLPVTFETRIRSQESSHLQPSGDIRVLDLFGRETAVMPVNPSGVHILPHSIRRITSSWMRKNEPTGTGFFQELSAEAKGFAYGIYIATERVSYAPQTASLEATTSFFVLPWRITILALCTIAVLIGAIAGYNRLRRV